MKLPLKVNGRDITVETSESVMLVDVLRDQVGLTGPRATCGVGLCGTCTVLLDGQPVSSCILMAPLALGKEISVGPGGELAIIGTDDGVDLDHGDWSRLGTGTARQVVWPY